MIRLITTMVQIFLIVPALIGLRWMYLDVKEEYRLLNSQIGKEN